MAKEKGGFQGEYGPNGSVTEPLTPEEDKLQAELSQRSREDMTFICKTLADKLDLNTDNTAIMLSGGAESLCILWTLLSIGVRPTVISWTGGQEKESTDFRKAKQVAEFYDLPFHPLVVDYDPDKFCEHVVDALENHEMRTRPDFEVSWLYKSAFKKAKELNKPYLISGIGEGNQLALGRKSEIAGRQGHLSVANRSLNHGQSISDYQVFSLMRMARDEGIRLLVPAKWWGAIAQFSHLPFRLMNIPRNKIIFWRAYQPEIDECGVTVFVSPMQTGNSSAKELVEEAVTSSKFAKDYVEKHGGDPDALTRTSQIWYNFIKRVHGVSIPAGSNLSTDARDDKVCKDWSNWLFTGSPLSERSRDLGADEKQSVYRPETDAPDEDDLFSDTDIDEEADDEWCDPSDDCMPETLSNTDCFGLTLDHNKSMFGCPRARLGLCSPDKHNNTPYDERICEVHREAIDFGLLAIFRSAAFHQRVGFKELVEPILDIYSYVARRDQEIVTEAVRSLTPSDGTELFPGAPVPLGTWMERDGSIKPHIGSFDDIPSVSVEGVDREQFAIDCSDDEE